MLPLAETAENQSVFPSSIVVPFVAVLFNKWEFGDWECDTAFRPKSRKVLYTLPIRKLDAEESILACESD